MSLPKIVVHPLALLQITQDATHLIQNAPDAKRIMGILIGTYEDDTVTIFHSAQIPSNDFIEKMDISAKYFTDVFEEYSLLGWYTHLPSVPVQEHLDIHRQVAREKENRVFMAIDFAQTYDEESDIPIKFYVARENLFVEVKYSMASVEIERIGVTDIFNAGSSAKKDERERTELTYAIGQLKTKTDIIVKYLKAIQEGKIEKDEKILTKIADICERLPVSNNRVFKEELDKENEDAKLIVMMMELMKTVVVIGDQTHSYAELQKEYGEKIRREDEKRRMEGRMMDDHRGMFGMYGMGGMSGMNHMGLGRGSMEFSDDDDE